MKRMDVSTIIESFIEERKMLLSGERKSIPRRFSLDIEYRCTEDNPCRNCDMLQTLEASEAFLVVTKSSEFPRIDITKDEVLLSKSINNYIQSVLLEKYVSSSRKVLKIYECGGEIITIEEKYIPIKSFEIGMAISQLIDIYIKTEDESLTYLVDSIGKTQVPYTSSIGRCFPFTVAFPSYRSFSVRSPNIREWKDDGGILPVDLDISFFKDGKRIVHASDADVYVFNDSESVKNVDYTNEKIRSFHLYYSIAKILHNKEYLDNLPILGSYFSYLFGGKASSFVDRLKRESPEEALVGIPLRRRISGNFPSI